MNAALCPSRRAICAVVLSLFTSACGDSATSDGPAVERIETTPAQLQLQVGETKAVTARALDAAGSVVSRKFFWSTPDPTIVTVTQEGIVTAVGPGTTQVAVSGGGKSVVVPVSVAGRPASLVRVTPATSSVRVGESASLAAEVLDASGAVVPGRTIEWSSSSVSVASVNANGVVTGIAPGNATITATSGDVSGTAVVSVQLVPVASLTLSPASSTMLAGESQQLTAVAKDADGAALPGRVVTWTTSAPTVATVSSTGFVIALTPGMATITATSEGKSATASITVTAVPVAAVTVVPSAATVAVKQSAQLLARVVDSSGAVLNGRPVSWSSDTPSIVTVDNNGVVTAVATGAARITATAEGKSGSSVVTVTPIPVASIAVTPTTLSLVQGATGQLAARLLDAQGNVLTGRVVSWISGAPSVADVDANGLVTAIGPGSALIIATSGGVRATVSVTVTAAAVSKVTVSPPTASLAQGRTLQLSVSITDSRGAPMAGKVATWQSSDPTVATVSSTGLFRAVAPGSATITATADGVSGTASVTVTLVPVASVAVSPSNASLVTGRTLQLSLTLEDASGNPLSVSGRSVSWSSSATSVASVSTTGVVTGTTAGSATITATVDGKSGSASLSVTDIAVSSVTVSPATAQLAVGGTRQFSAAARDASGGAITGRPVSWSSSNTAVATVSSTGLVSAIAAGTAQVVATISGVQGSATATVTTVPVASVSVTPSSASLTIGGTAQLSATAKDANGNTLSGRTATWSSDDNAVATVDANGLVTAVGAGSAKVTATIDGVSASATITGAAVAAASVAVSPSTVSVAEGATTTLTATVKDAQGNTLAGRALTWSSDDAAVATVSSSGVVTGISPGTATITATAAGGTAPSGSSTVTVTMAPVLSLTISPANPTITVGRTLALTATLLGAVPNVPLPIAGRTLTWSVANSAVATISSAGVVTGVSAGTTTVTASAASLGQATPATATVTLSVAAPSVAGASRVVISPLTGTVHAGTLYARAVSAQALDASGAVMPNEAISWSTSDPAALAVASTSAQGATLTAQGAPTSGIRVIASTSGSSPVADTLTISTDFVPVASVTVAPTSVTLVFGTSQTVVATALDSAGNAIGSANGNPLGTRSVAWTSTDTRTATVSSTGVISALKRGNATVEARVGSVGPATVAVTVTNPSGSSVVSSVAVSPSSVTLVQGGTATLQAVALDGNGNALTGEPIAWSVNGTVATLSTTTGAATTVTAIDSGTVQIDATSQGKTGRATVRISLPPLGVDHIESIPSRGSPTVTLSSRSGRAVKVMFRVLSSSGKLAGQPFQVVSSDAGVATISITGSAVTDNSGKGEFVVNPGRSARRGDAATITVTAGGKSLVWSVSIT